MKTLELKSKEVVTIYAALANEKRRLEKDIEFWQNLDPSDDETIINIERIIKFKLDNINDLTETLKKF